MTKTIAKAAQKFPHSGGLVRVSQRGVLALMLGTVALPVSGAWAEVLLGLLYNNTITRTSVSPLVVTTTSDFSVNTTAGRGIDLYSQGGISFTDTNQAAITGFGKGINAWNNDAAGLGGLGGTALTITTNGLVTGKDIPPDNYGYNGEDGIGINAKNQYGGNLTISVTSVTGDFVGIRARGEGNTGALLIDATGVVTGTNDFGIDAYNQGTNLTISANSVSGGIYALNKGSGEAYIKTTGDVTHGIQATNKYGTDLTIDTAKVSGSISATQEGTGALAITASDDVSGGILASNTATATSLTISATSVSGSFTGISATNSGTDALSVTATGAVTGTKLNGIYAYNKGTSLTISAASVSGKDFGIKAKNVGSGPLTITVSGDVSATSFVNVVGPGSAPGMGIFSYAGPGAEVTINLLSTSSVNAQYAIVDMYGDAEVTISGGALVTGGIGLQYGNDTLTIGAGVDLSGVTLMSGGDDVKATHYTDTLNISSGWLVGNLNDWEEINADTSGGDFALNGFSLGSRSLSKLGAGTLTLNGALTLASGSTLSMGVPQSATDPLILATGAATIAGDLIVTPGQTLTFGQEYILIAANSLTGTFDSVSISGGYTTTLTYTATSVLLRFDPITPVTPDGFGIYAKNYSAGPLEITTSGVVLGSTLDGVYAYNSSNGTDLTIAAVDPVSGDRDGINATNNGTGKLEVTTSGTVSGGSGAGISTNSAEGAAVEINVLSTSRVSATSGVAIMDGDGNAVVTIDAGAVVEGSISLGSGDDTLNIASGVELYDGTVLSLGRAVAFNSASNNPSHVAFLQDASGPELSGGDGTDTLNINSGWSGSLNDWEVMNVNTNAGDFMLGGVVSGTGTLTKLGAGTLTLSGANTFSGGLTISAGSVSGTANSFGTGNIVNNSALVFDDSYDGTFNAAISSSGSLTKLGAGTLTLSGANTFSGGLTISQGRLNVLGSVAASAVTIQSGASLGGNGTIGSLIAQSGSIVSPGNSIGTMSVDGNVMLAMGSTLAMEIGQSSSDLIHATGSASLAGNLVVTPGQTITYGQNYTLIEASALTGTFGNVSIEGGYNATLRYTDTSFILRFDRNSLVALGGNTFTLNALAVAKAFDAAVGGGNDPAAFATVYTQADTLNAKLGELSGELHSAERRVALADTSVVREAALDRLGYGLTGGADATAATGGGGAFWMRDFASWGTADADGTGSRATTDQAGFLMGADFVQGNVKYGGMFSYTNTNVDLGSLGYSKTNSTGAALYAGYRQDGAGLAFAVGGAFASTSATGERSISITGLEQTLTSTVQGTSYQIFGEVSNDMAKAGNVQIEPFARLAYAWAHSDAFAETGGSAALSGAKQSNDLRMATLGLRGAYVAGDTTLSGSAAWLHSAGDLSAPTTLSMAGVDTPYEVNSAALDEDAVELAAQASVDLAPDMTLAGGYSGTIGKNNATHGVRVTLSVAW